MTNVHHRNTSNNIADVHESIRKIPRQSISHRLQKQALQIMVDMYLVEQDGTMCHIEHAMQLEIKGILFGGDVN